MPFVQQSPTIPAVGLNPFRTHEKTTVDVILVVAFVVITIGLVLWGFFG
jgi:hypothetical protein